MTLRPPRERQQNKYDQEDYFTPNNPELENIEVFIIFSLIIFQKTIMTEKLT